MASAVGSERMASTLPKPYLQLGDEPMMRRTIKAFLGQPGIDGVRVVIRREHHIRCIKRRLRGYMLFPRVIGG